ncbi:MAG: DUF2235 domain-containing protein [Calditrichaeota bacterium]|nr:DUF2235 domain-containing protein [Calditrichota bacterium]
MPKNIVLCFDGTGNEFGVNNTNVVLTMRAIIKDQLQIANYDPGVGTFSIFGRTIGKKVGRVLGLAFGYGLEQNIEDGYRYLMDCYEDGDRVSFFGFSRGAFTARALAGMIHHYGILHPKNENLIPYVSDMYTSYHINKEMNQDRRNLARQFRSIFSRSCPIHFIGVWDTVKSLGWLMGKKFFDQTLHYDVKYGYHAVSIDERRRKFPVTLWDLSKKRPDQTIEQVWFSGVHSNVGGWYDQRGLSDIALAWMMDKAESAGLNLRSNWRNTIEQNPGDFLHNSRKGFWCLWPSVRRTIAAGSSIHQSVFDRIKLAETSDKITYGPNLGNSFEIVSNPSYQPKTEAIGQANTTLDSIKFYAMLIAISALVYWFGSDALRILQNVLNFLF